MYKKPKEFESGMTFIDVIIGTSLALIFFMGLIGAFRLALKVYQFNKAQASAIAIGNERIEYIRSVPYDSVGTVAGIPDGTIPQNETQVSDNIPFTVRTFIKYVDDPADGTVDTGDPLPADYKQVKVDVSWSFSNAMHTVSFLTTVVPQGQESLAGAGVLTITVKNALAAPVYGASVHIFNTAVGTSGVDVIAYTNASGTVSFPGALAGTGYNIVVSKTNYSSAQTYVATTSNPSPSPSPATVVENSSTGLLFAIDLLSSLTVHTFAPPVRGSLDDTFADASNLATTSNAVVASGALQLFDTAGVYASSGIADSVTLAPTSPKEWVALSFTANTPTNTTANVQVLYDTGSGFAPVPTSALPGNNVGFSSSPIDLGALSTATYPSLRLRALLGTSDTAVTPSINEWHLSYLAQPVARPTIPFHIYGVKTIGTDSGGAPIYKYDNVFTTDASGVKTINPIEWDRYTIGPDGVSYDTAYTCPAPPYDVSPNTPYTLDIALLPSSGNALLVQTISLLGTPVARTEVHLYGAGYDDTEATDECGYAVLRGFSGGSYTLDTLRAGYGPTTQSINITGSTSTVVTLP